MPQKQQVPQIDEEFKALVYELPPHEKELLEASLHTEGCRDPLAVWTPPGAKKPLLLDGHHRKAICEAHDPPLPYNTVPITLPDRDAAKWWIMQNQLGRRNLTLFGRCELVLQYEPIVKAMTEAERNSHLKRGSEAADVTE